MCADFTHHPPIVLRLYEIQRKWELMTDEFSNCLSDEHNCPYLPESDATVVCWNLVIKEINLQIEKRIWNELLRESYYGVIRTPGMIEYTELINTRIYFAQAINAEMTQLHLDEIETLARLSRL